jgi:hypothetical protein
VDCWDPGQFFAINVTLEMEKRHVSAYLLSSTIYTKLAATWDCEISSEKIKIALANIVKRGVRSKTDL